MSAGTRHGTQTLRMWLRLNGLNGRLLLMIGRLQRRAAQTVIRAEMHVRMIWRRQHCA